MLATNLKRAILKRGGEATIGPDHVGRTVLEGTLNGYDVHMYNAENSYYTVRKIANRGHHDPFSDYNPGGWTFCNLLKDLDWSAAA